MSGFDLSFIDKKLDREVVVFGAANDALCVKFEDKDAWHFQIKRKFGQKSEERINTRLVRPGLFYIEEDDEFSDKLVGVLDSALLLVLDR